MPPEVSPPSGPPSAFESIDAGRASAFPVKCVSLGAAGVSSGCQLGVRTRPNGGEHADAPTGSERFPCGRRRLWKEHTASHRSNCSVHARNKARAVHPSRVPPRDGTAVTKDQADTWLGMSSWVVYEFREKPWKSLDFLPARSLSNGRDIQFIEEFIQGCSSFLCQRR